MLTNEPIIEALRAMRDNYELSWYNRHVLAWVIDMIHAEEEGNEDIH